MTSAEFEKQAKKAVADLMGTVVGIGAEDLETVWFAHVLGNKKCLLFAPKAPNVYFEVTYNFPREEIYVDVYNNGKNVCFVRNDIGEYVKRNELIWE